ncbi:hypothetical protein RGQ15_08910 [Paracoccus sp. MBLB3053]|uniref:Uncharacterized protein n=1 Tax=Paracoccus aurantius TaxID=3073814 RepID=A0ABU2HTR5_9RHOB|nr:hypothetical protein [Paracoccus sp. MBLB3053]MDS9467689.1 hypothetical protein [Paracoccus sp. MBLB3053]
MTKGPVSTGQQSATEGGLDAVLLRVGRLNYAWSNTESLLVHLLAGLAEMPKDAAVVVFLSVSSTRGRIELIERLAKLRRPSGAEQQELLELMARFGRLSAVRNRYNHSIWSFDENGSISTILMRIADRRDRIHMGRRQMLDADEIGKLDQDLDTLSTLNRSIWRFLKKHGYSIE